MESSEKTDIHRARFEVPVPVTDMIIAKVHMQPRCAVMSWFEASCNISFYFGNECSQTTITIWWHMRRNQFSSSEWASPSMSERGERSVGYWQPSCVLQYEYRMYFFWRDFLPHSCGVNFLLTPLSTTPSFPPVELSTAITQQLRSTNVCAQCIYNCCNREVRYSKLS